MQYVFVVDNQKQPLMPCHPARARQLLKQGKAAVYRCQPFTIILKEREGGDTQPLEVKIDPGSRETGIAAVVEGKRGKRVVWGAVLTHRGQTVKDALEKRRAIRRSRRARHTRYRQPRFLNRTRPAGWLPPSVESRINNVTTWMRRLRDHVVPVTALAQELVRFDTQLMQNAEITGIAYQQGTLQGYEVVAVGTAAEPNTIARDRATTRHTGSMRLVSASAANRCTLRLPTTLYLSKPLAAKTAR